MKTIDFIVGKFYQISQLKEHGFRYNPRVSSCEWKAWEKDNIRLHMRYGEYRFSFHSTGIYGMGYIAESFGMRSVGL